MAGYRWIPLKTQAAGLYLDQLVPRENQHPAVKWARGPSGPVTQINISEIYGSTQP